MTGPPWAARQLARDLRVMVPMKALSTANVGEHMTPCPYVIEFDRSLQDASILMAEHTVRHLPVTREGQVVGILSDRDIAAVEALAPTQAERVRVVEAMTPAPYCVPLDTPVSEVVRTMARHKYGCTIVTNPRTGAAIGVFTTTDALVLLDHVLGQREQPLQA